MENASPTATTSPSQLNGSDVQTNFLSLAETNLRVVPRNRKQMKKAGSSDVIETTVVSNKRGRPPGKMKKQDVQNRAKTVNPAYEREEPLTREDVKCPICFGIFLEPVTFPCTHSMCLDCYKQHVEKTSLQCPMCRFRLSVWSRRMSKNNFFVNAKFWERIKEQFSEEVLRRQEGDDSQNILSPRKDNIRDGRLAAQGEISQEFTELLQKHTEELENERQKEEAATQKLINRLQEEEGPLPSVQLASELEQDMEFARKIQEDLNKEDKTKDLNNQDASTISTRHRPNIFVPTPKSENTKMQKKLNFKKVTQHSDPTSTQTLPLLEEKVPLNFPAPPPPGVSYEEDFKLAKRLQSEERKLLELERLNARERMTTRQLSKSNNSINDKKRSSSSTQSSQVSKRRKSDLILSHSQRTLDNYFSPSPPSAAAGAPPRSRSNTPDSINEEFSHYFQPIVRPPKTPPKVNPDGTVEPTLFVNLLSKNLSSTFTSTNTE